MRKYITPIWPAPAHVKTCVSTRQHGLSDAPYASFNLGDHVGDEPACVQQNRMLLKQDLQLQHEPLWLRQVHGHTIIAADTYYPHIEADGCYAVKKQQVCAVLTADCLPLLLTNTAGSFVMALHVGWRGLVSGIIEKGVEIAQNYDAPLLAWLGPAIGADVFEVGTEVKAIFVQQDPRAEDAFKPSPQRRWLMDIYQIARQRLRQSGVQHIYAESNCSPTVIPRPRIRSGAGFDRGIHDEQCSLASRARLDSRLRGNDERIVTAETLCSYKNEALFYSYRRDGQTGRMATLIWLQ